MLYVLLSRSRAARSSVSAVDLRANADEWADGAKMETFGLPRLQPAAFSVCTVSYFNTLRIFPGWKHIIFCPKSRLPSAVLQSDAFGRRLTSLADLDQKKRGAALFNTAAYQRPPVALKSESAGRDLEY